MDKVETNFGWKESNILGSPSFWFPRTDSSLMVQINKDYVVKLFSTRITRPLEFP